VIFLLFWSASYSLRSPQEGLVTFTTQVPHCPALRGGREGEREGGREGGWIERVLTNSIDKRDFRVSEKAQGRCEMNKPER